MPIADWLVPAATVIVAFLTFGGVVYQARRNKEPRMSEVWTENSNLRDRIDKQDDKIQKQDEKLEKLETDLATTNENFSKYKTQAENKIGILGMGFDVLFRLFGHISTDQLADRDMQAVNAARALRESSTTHPIVLNLQPKEG